LQKPKLPLSDDKTYDVEIVLSYEEELLAQKIALEEENERLKEEAAKEKEAYEEKSTGTKLAEKVLLGEKKPTGEADLIDAPFYQTLWNKEELKAKYVFIPGLNQENGAKALVKVYVNQFDWTYTAQHIDDKGYYYRVNAVGTITMAAFNAAGEKIAGETFQVSQIGKGNDFQSKYFKSAYLRDKDWNINKESKLRAIEAKKLDINMNSMRGYLQQNMAYNEVAYKSIIFTFKAKNQKYDELNAVYPQILESYNMLNADPVSESTKANISKSMAVWEAAQRVRY
jgi:hypothetical protein